MAGKLVKVWFDREADFLEVNFEPDSLGHFRETADDRVMERVDSDGRVIGFSITGVSSLQSSSPIDLLLRAAEGQP